MRSGLGDSGLTCTIILYMFGGGCQKVKQLACCLAWVGCPRPHGEDRSEDPECCALCSRVASGT